MSEERLRQLVAAHDAVFTGLLDATQGLDASDWSTPTGCPGWDVHDQLAHCIGIERLMLGDPLPQVELPDLDHVDDDFSRVTELDVEVRRGVDGDALRDEACETFDRRLAALESMTPEDLEAEIDSPIGRTRAAKVLRTRVFDLVAHEQDIRRALDRETEPSGAHLDIAVEQVLRAWAALLPDRLGAQGVLGLDVEGRGRVALDLASGELHRGEEGTTADAVVSLRVRDVISLGCGRVDAPDLDELAPSGDRALATAFVYAASVTP